MDLIRKSVVIGGSTTSIALEKAFWDELDLRSREAGASWADFLRQLLFDEIDTSNRASAVREKLLLMLRSEVDKVRYLAAIVSSWIVKDSHGIRNVYVHGTRLLVGRDIRADIVINDDEVSRIHLMLAFDGTSWWGVDLDSKNGTRLGRKRMKCSKIAVGDELHLGSARLQLMS